MTSSFRLQKRLENGQDYSARGYWSHYVEASGSKPCHPDYIAQSIGHADGVKICHRKYVEREVVADSGPNFAKRQPQKYITYPNSPDREADDPAKYNGYNKFSADLYRPWRNTQIQLDNPYAYSDRRPPWQAYNISHGFLKPKVNYNATGLEQLRTASEGSFRDGGEENYRFTTTALGYTKDPPSSTGGLRGWSDRSEYDVTKLVQPIPMWVNEQRYLKGQPPLRSVQRGR